MNLGALLPLIKLAQDSGFLDQMKTIEILGLTVTATKTQIEKRLKSGLGL